MNFTCYGGCVSRDIFNVPGIDELQCVLTIGQNPVSTMFRNKANIEFENFKTKHNFSNKMLYYDANKMVFEKLKEVSTDFILIDLICERITIFVFSYQGTEVWMCKNMPFVETWSRWSAQEENQKFRKIKNIHTKNLGEEYEKDIMKFAKQLMQLYPRSKIIYNKVRLVDYYQDKQQTIKQFNRDGYKIVFNYNIPSYGNDVIQRAERTFLQTLCEQKEYFEDDGIHIIPFPEYTLGSTGHHFGLHPLHFHDEYYWYAAEALKIIVTSNNKEEEMRRLKELLNYQNKMNKYRFEKNIIGREKI